MIIDLLIGTLAIATIAAAGVLELRVARRLDRKGARRHWPILY